MYKLTEFALEGPQENPQGAAARSGADALAPVKSINALWSDEDLPPPLNRPPMSPMTAGLFLALGVALASLDGRCRPGRRRLASACACGVLLLCFVVVVGYAHDVELLRTFLGIPVAFWTATTFATLAVGVIAAQGPDRFPLRPLVGPSTRAFMLRTILPEATEATAMPVSIFK